LESPAGFSGCRAMSKRHLAVFRCLDEVFSCVQNLHITWMTSE
jgi:hypothetical protein